MDANLGSLEARVAKGGVDAVLDELRAEQARGNGAGDAPLLDVLEREAPALRRWGARCEPGWVLQQVHNRAFELGLDDLKRRAEAQLVARGQPYLRERTRTDRTSRALLRTLTGHAGAVNAVALRADGRVVVSASSDRTIKVWDVAEGRAVHTLEGHEGPATAVAVRADGRVAVSGSVDGTLRVWDVVEGRALGVLSGHGGTVHNVVLDAESRIAVSASADRTLRIWDLEAGRERHVLRGHTKAVLAAALSADGALVVSASADRSIRVWSVSGHALRTLSVQKAAVNGIAVTPDGRILTASDDGVMGSLDLSPKSWVSLATLARVTDVDDPADPQEREDDARFHVLRREGASGSPTKLHRIAASPDGRQVVAASEDGHLLLQSRDRPLQGPRLSGHEGAVLAVTVSADGTRMASGSADGTVRVWDLFASSSQSGLMGVTDLSATSAHADRVPSVAMMGDGRTAISASTDRSLIVWNLAVASATTLLLDPDAAVRAVATTPDGRFAVSGCADGSVKIWELLRVPRETMLPLRGSLTGLSVRRPLRTLAGHGETVNGVAVTADALFVVSGASDGLVKVWSLPDGEFIRTLEGHAQAVTGVAVTSDGEHVVSASLDHTARVWRLADGALLRTLEGHGDAVNGVAVTPDGRAITASSDRTVKVWRVADGALLHTLEGHGDAVTGAAATADGRFVVSTSLDETLRLWRTDGGDAIATLATHRALLCCAASAIDAGIVAGDWASPLMAPPREMPGHRLDALASTPGRGAGPRAGHRLEQQCFIEQQRRVVRGLLGRAMRRVVLVMARGQTLRARTSRREAPPARVHPRAGGGDPCDAALDDSPRLRARPPLSRRGSATSQLPPADGRAPHGEGTASRPADEAPSARVGVRARGGDADQHLGQAARARAAVTKVRAASASPRAEGHALPRGAGRRRTCSGETQKRAIELLAAVRAEVARLDTRVAGLEERERARRDAGGHRPHLRQAEHPAGRRPRTPDRDRSTDPGPQRIDQALLDDLRRLEAALGEGAHTGLDAPEHGACESDADAA